jgi:hypothetical protein
MLRSPPGGARSPAYSFDDRKATRVTSDTSRAGVHIDGNIATIAIVHGGDSPSVESTHAVRGATHSDVLAQALKLVPSTYPVRVTFTAAGVHSTPIDISAAHLTRRAFTAKARHLLPAGATGSPVAGILGDLDKVADGQLETGLAFTAPGDLVDDLYRAGHTHPLEVTTSSAAAGSFEDGQHLCLRMGVSELFVVADRKVTAAHVLTTPGLSQLFDAVGRSEDRFDRALAGEGGDPLAASVLAQTLSQTFAEVRSIMGEPSTTREPLFIHGPAAVAEDLLVAAGTHHFTPAQHTLPLRVAETTYESYCAAATAGQNSPYATFLNKAVIDESRHTSTRIRRRKTARSAAGYCVAVVLAAAGPAAAATGWAAWSDRQADSAYAEAIADPARAKDVSAVQLTELRADQRASASTVAAIASVNVNGADITALHAGPDHVRVQLSGDKTDAWVRDLRTKASVQSVTRRGSQVTVIVKAATP